MNPRATKDLDLVLVVEALTPDFGLRLWDFIKAANYGHRSQGGETNSNTNIIVLPILKTRPIRSK